MAQIHNEEISKFAQCVSIMKSSHLAKEFCLLCRGGKGHILNNVFSIWRTTILQLKNYLYTLKLVSVLEYEK